MARENILGCSSGLLLTGKVFYDDGSARVQRGAAFAFTEQPVGSGLYVADAVEGQLVTDIVVAYDAVGYVASGYMQETVYVADKTGFSLAATGADLVKEAIAALASTKVWEATTSGSLILQWIKDVLEGDAIIDTSNAAQYKLVIYKKGTPATVLITKNLNDIEGAAIVSNTTAIAQHKEPVV